MDQGFINGFTKAAQRRGLTDYQIQELLKEANFADDALVGVQNFAGKFGIGNDGIIGKIISKLRGWFGEKFTPGPNAPKFQYQEPQSTNTSPMRLANQPAPAPVGSAKPLLPFQQQAQGPTMPTNPNTPPSLGRSAFLNQPAKPETRAFPFNVPPPTTNTSPIRQPIPGIPKPVQLPGR